MTTAQFWNERYPIGTLVKVKTAHGDLAAKTRGSAYHLSGGTAIVPLDGKIPRAKLTEVEPLTPAAPTPGMPSYQPGPGVPASGHTPFTDPLLEAYLQLRGMGL